MEDIKPATVCRSFRKECQVTDITKIDKNFAIKTEIKKDGFLFFDVENEPFSVYGVRKDNGLFRRLPEQVAKAVSEGVWLNTAAAGGRVRFRTDSKRIAIMAQLKDASKFPHMAFTGSIGFDLYARIGHEERYIQTFVPEYGIEDNYEGVVCVEEDGMKTFTLNLSLYAAVAKILIGIEEGATLEKAEEYTVPKPVVFYGSSITQGGCASRPGNSYQSILSRKFDFDFINLGFSGCAKAEETIFSYMKDLDMAVFVYDYDHNAPTVSHLRETHEKGYRMMRCAHPQLPIILLSRPKYHLNAEERERRDIIRTTYENALRRGDRNVWFLDGRELMSLAGDDGTEDGCHPNDWGFYSMACALQGIMKTILSSR